MSLVSGIDSIEEMEATLKAAMVQYRLNPTPANGQYLKDLLIAWRRQEWVIPSVLKQLNRSIKSSISGTVSISDGDSEHVFSKAASRTQDFLGLAVSVRLYHATTEFMIQYFQGFEVYIELVATAAFPFRQGYRGSTYGPIVDSGTGVWRTTVHANLAPIYLEKGAHITLAVTNHTGQDITTDGYISGILL